MQWIIKRVGMSVGGAALAFALVTMVGCGSSYPSTVAVTGIVTYKGKAVEDANVVLGRGGRSMAEGELALGKTDSEGHFNLTSHFAGEASSSGVVPGDYEVTISKMVPPPGMTMAQYQALADAAKAMGESGAMVPANKRPPLLVEMLPSQYSMSGKSKLKAAISASGSNELKFELD